MVKSETSKTAAFLLSVVVMCLSGCGNSDLEDIASSVQDAASQGIEQVQESASETAGQVQDRVAEATTDESETLSLAGSMDVTLDAPVKTSACYVKLITSNAGRPTVLQLQSYEDAEQESFPSVLVNAQVSEGELTALVGQTVAAQMYVQPDAEGPIWLTKTEPVQVKINSIEEKLVSGEVVGGTLHNTGTGETLAAKAAFQGVLQ